MANSKHELRIDIQGDINALAYHMLEQDGYRGIKKESALEQYYYIRHRTLSIKPRAIVKAKEFMCPREAEEELSFFETAVTNGLDLTPFMSKTIDNASYSDKLFNDWGLVHFHLSHCKDKNDRFMARADYLLIVYFEPQNDGTLYFLQVRAHEKMNWSEQQLIRIIDDNWPDLLRKYKFPGYGSLTEKISDEDYNRLRRANINSAVDLHDGRVIIGPNMGLSGNGHSVMASIMCINTMNAAARMQIALVQRADEICSVIKNNLMLSDHCYELTLKALIKTKYIFTVNGDKDRIIGAAFRNSNDIIIATGTNERAVDKKLERILNTQ